MQLDHQGHDLLRLLMSLLPEVNSGHPEKMIGYKEVHEKLGLSQRSTDWGESLKRQGLDNLAQWTKAHDLPAITGIIVNKTKGSENEHSPGKGYFGLFDRENLDWPWWSEQIESAKNFDWESVLPTTPVGSGVVSSFSNSLQYILDNYEVASDERFSDHELAKYIRNNLPKQVAKWVEDQSRYELKGSPGQGVWAEVPWVSVIDRLITDTVQEGFYLVYLFDAKQRGVFLSLNQGVTSVKHHYGSGAAQALTARAKDLLARLGNLAGKFDAGPIDLSIRNVGAIGNLYEAGSVCSAYYESGSIPSDDELRSDFHHFMLMYEDLAAKDDRFFRNADSEDDEAGLEEEDARVLREHKRIERNRSLARKAKQVHGYKCKACGFDFEERYGAIGREFIEAHHLEPLAKLKGKIVKLDPMSDFTVLCSNCHRMIHKTDTVGDVQEFRATYLHEGYR